MKKFGKSKGLVKSIRTSHLNDELVIKTYSDSNGRKYAVLLNGQIVRI